MYVTKLRAPSVDFDQTTRRYIDEAPRTNGRGIYNRFPITGEFLRAMIYRVVVSAFLVAAMAAVSSAQTSRTVDRGSFTISASPVTVTAGSRRC